MVLLTRRFLLALLFTPSLVACTRSAGPRIRKPDGVEIEYVPEKQTYFLGEPIYVHFCFKNTADEPFSFRYGADHRGAARPLRFMFRATAASGKRVPDPHPDEYYWKDMERVRIGEIKPGVSPKVRFLLQAWCEFDRPGKYTVTAGQDIGWDEPVKELSTPGWSRSMGGSFSVRLVAPADEDCPKVVDAMVRGMLADKNDRMVPDPFFYIRHPAYLGPLRKLTSDGNREVRQAAIDGIGSILTPEATRALIGLLDHDDPTTARLAAQTLNWRLPDRSEDYNSAVGRSSEHEYMFGPAMRSAFSWAHRNGHSKGKRREAIRLGWRDDLAKLVRPHARRMLKSGNREDIRLGSLMVQCLGDAESLDLVLSTIDRHVEQAQAANPQWPTFSPYFCKELIATAQLLTKFGVAPPQVGRIETVGEALLWIELTRCDDNYRTRGWEAEYMRCLKHINSVVRLVAVGSMPKDIIPSASDQLVALAKDPHHLVRCRTIEVLRNHRLKSFLPVALDRLRKDNDRVVLMGASFSCETFGDTSHIDVLIERLTDARVCLPVHQILFDKTTESGCAHPTDPTWTVAEREKLQSQWREWFKVNGEALKKLGPLPPGDARFGPRPKLRGFEAWDSDPKADR